MIKLIIADDHPLIIEGMRSAIQKDEEVLLLDEVSSGVELLKVMNKEPDVVIMDINMPDMDGIEAPRNCANPILR